MHNKWERVTHVATIPVWWSDESQEILISKTLICTHTAMYEYMRMEKHCIALLDQLNVFSKFFCIDVDQDVADSAQAL